MSTTSRYMAIKGEYVRLYCTFEYNGRLADPGTQPVVEIVTDAYLHESSSSSTEREMSTSSLSISGSSESSTTEHHHGTGFGPFYAQRESTGIWYIDWFVPEDIPDGNYYDVWKFFWAATDTQQKMVFPITILPPDSYLNYVKPALAQKIGDCAVEMLRELNCSLIWEAQHIPVYWEQGYRTGPKTLNFAYNNWNDDPRPLLRKNNELMTSGWKADMNGTIWLDRPMDPEDQWHARYYFRYFSDECLLTFLNEGLYMMNGTPPASQTYSDLCSAPFAWRGGIMLYASIQALRRLIFGISFQERAIIYGEDPARAQDAQNRYQQLYQDYMTLWMEMRKDIKSKVLPPITQYVTPEYTLPGGRCCSHDTLIRILDGDKVTEMTIAEAYVLMSNGKKVVVQTMKGGNVSFSSANKIWESGEKFTYVVRTESHEIRLSEDHLVFDPERSIYVPVKVLKMGCPILSLKNGSVVVEKMVSDPIPYGIEKTYDIEVPETENFFGNGISSHNSRWFRYLYK